MKPKYPRCSLGGFPLRGVVTWNMREGVAPAQSLVTMDRKDAENLVNDKIRGVKLRMHAGQTETEISGVIPVQIMPADSPHEVRVLIADRRWFWSRRHVRRRYNIRRRVGTKRQANPLEPAVSAVSDLVQYAPWSTRSGVGGTPDAWRPLDVLMDILKECTSSEQDVNAPPNPVFERLSEMEGLPIEGLVIDANAASALEIVLASFPDVGVTIDHLGRIVVYFKGSGEERDLVAGMSEFVDAGHIEQSEQHRVRPSAVHVLFDREIEVRFDAAIPGQTVTPDDRYMENVLPVPDFELDVRGEKVSQGTWISLESAFDAWGILPGIGVKLSDELMRKAFLPHMGLWEGMLLAGQRDPDADWVARIAAVQQHWRQTYRVNRRWADRILRVLPHRVATIDPTTGTRAPSLIFSNFAVMGTQRTFLLDAAAGQSDASYAMNVLGFPADGKIGTDTKPAPAKVTVLDDDQFILRFDYLLDPARTREVVMPSMVEIEGDNTGDALPTKPGPTADVTDRTRPIGWNLLTRSQRPPSLTRDHKIAVIVTALPASPNSAEQMHCIEVKPEDVKDMLPKHARDSLDRCSGPVLQVAVGANLETARVAWLDSSAEKIEKAFGLRGGDKTEQGDGESERAILDELTVNATQSAGGAAALNQIAKAQAAAIYASLSDRHIGSASTAFHQQFRPRGRAAEVTHEINSEGIASSTITLPDRLEPVDLTAYLSANVRRRVLGLVQGGRVA